MLPFLTTYERRWSFQHRLQKVKMLLLAIFLFSISCVNVKTPSKASSAILSVSSGSGQTLKTNSQSSQQLQVVLLSKGKPLSGETVKFALTSGTSVKLKTDEAITNASGIAAADFESTVSVGLSIVTASWAGQSVEFEITTTEATDSGSADTSGQLLLMQGGGQSTDPGQTFSQSLKVKAIDDSGAPVAGESIIFSQSGGSVAITLSASVVQTNSQGEAESVVAAGNVQGTATVVATWKTHSVSFTLTISRDEHLNIIDGNLQTAAPGQSFTSPLKVQFIRASLPVSGTTVNFAVQSGAGVTLSSSSGTTDTSGLAQTTVTANGSTGSTVIRASVGATYTDFTLSTIPQSSTTIHYVSGNGQSGSPAATASSPLVVEVRNSTDSSLAQNVLVRFSVTTGNGKVGTGLNQSTYDVVTDSLGQATTAFKFGTTAGANAIEAKIVGNPTQTYNFSATTVVSASATVDLSTSSITASPTSLTANGVSQSTLTFTARDAYGNQIPTSSGTVVFTPTAGTLSGGVSNHGDGRWTQILVAPGSKGSGSLTVTATYNASALTSTALTITLVSGTISAANSDISLGASSIVANGSATTTITVNIRDAYGNLVGSGGETVVITTTAGTLLGTVTDVGDGTYSQVIRSSTLAQAVSISATVGGIAVGTGANLIFAPGSIDLTKCSLSVSPSIILPNGTATTTVTVTLRDVYQNQLTSGGATVALSSTHGSWVGSVIDNNDGTYQRILQAASSAATATVSATVNASAISATAKVYMTNGESGPSLLTSLVEIVGGTTQVAADGTTTANVRVTLKDSTSTQMATGGSTVVITASAGTLLGSVIDNGNGTYTQTIRAPSSSAIASITATVDGLTIIDNASLQFYGAISLANSTLSSYPPSAIANGTSTVLLLLQAKDTSGITIPVGGETGIAFASTAGSLQGSLTDNANGTYTQYLLAPGSAANASVSATKSASAFSSTTSVTFYTATNRAGLTIDCSNIASYTGTNITVDNGTLTMNSYGTASSGADCAASFSFGAIVLTNSGIITHSATTASSTSAGQEYRLELTATSISIDATSKFDVNGKGFVHNSSDTASYYRVQGNTQSASTPYYGSLFYPNDLGASGALYNSSNIGSAGGGRLKITVSNGGQLVNNGTISANGASYSTGYGGSGWGGSIQIITGSLSGTGSITANGGTLTGNASGAMSGNGGRIAIYYTSTSGNFSLPTSVISNVNACGGTNSSSGYDGHAGTVFIKSATQSYGDLILNNCSRSTTLNTLRTQINSPSNSTPTSLTGTILTKTGAFGDTFTTTKNPYVGWYINPNISQNATSARADDTTFLITSGSTDSVTISTGNMLSIADSSKTYQFTLLFDNLQVAGRASVTSSAPMIVAKGDLSSNDETTVSYVGYAPSEVEFQNVLTYTFDGSSSYAGTSSITNPNFGTAPVTFKNITMTLSNITSGALTLDGANITMSCVKGTTCVSSSGTLTLTNTSTLTQKATTSSVEYSLEISAVALTLNAGSTISAAGKGFNYTGSSSGYYYQGIGNITYTGSSNGQGGSHGGRGAYSPNSVYGSMYSPYTSGSSGTTYNSGHWGGAGGGIIRINLSGGSATIDGTIDANGAATPQTHGGGGAGGSIYISAGSVSGGGTLRANGGSSSGQWGGGGGRIALHYSSTSGGFTYPTSILSRFTTYGGTGVSNGAAGTVFLKSSAQTYGDLYVNNNNLTSLSGYNTYLNTPANAASASLTATTLTNSGAFAESSYLTNHLVGFSVNPKTTQNSSLTYGDDTSYLISSYTANVLTVASGDMTSIATASNTYEIRLVLDNLEVSGKGILEVNSPVVVRYGDISGNTTDSLTAVGGLLGVSSAAYFEFLNLASATFNASGSSINLNTVSASGAITFINGTQSANLITGTNLTVDATTLTMGALKGQTCINMSGDVILQNTATLIQKTTTPTAEYALEVIAANLTVQSGSTLSAAGRGYAYTGTTVGFFSQVFPNTTYTGWASGHGGSHGGEGAYNSFGTYGSMYSPNTSGSSGSTYNSGHVPGSGGGILKVIVTSTVSVDGTIDANGAGSGNYAGGGAGGSIYIAADTVSGGGTIRSSGGTSPNGYGGGGGRIAIHYTTLSGGFSYPTNILSRLQAYGGSSTGSVYGAAGTIFLRSAAQTYGDLYINNNGNSSYSGSTTLFNTPSNASSSALTATTLTNSSAFMESANLTNHLLGFVINPNTAQNSTATWDDETYFRISSQTINSLTISSGDMTSVASAGNTYRLMLVLDNLELVGKGILESTAPVIIKNGDISSNNTTTASTLGGHISTAGTGLFEWVGLTTATFNAGTSTQNHNLITGSATVTLSNGSHSFNSINATALTLSSSTTTMACLRLSSCITLTGALTLQSTSTLYHKATSSTEEFWLDIVAGSLAVNSGNTISGAARGYYWYGGSSGYYVQTLGNTATSTTTTSGMGGSHGGKGGSSSISTYGSLYNPNTSGSSGGQHGGGTPHFGTPGGGIVRITLGSGNAVVDGTIDVSSSTSGYGGGGAGGSIYISSADISGSGTLKSNGGASTNASGGGGGRIAIHYATASGGFSMPTTILGRLQAYGGSGSTSGAAGTIFLKSASQTYGDLYVNNNSLSTSSTTTTYINIPNRTNSTGVTSTTLSSGGAFSELGLNSSHLVGFYVNPDTTQNATATYNDDTVYAIASQTIDTLTTSSGNMTSIASAGDLYQVLLILDNLEISGSAKIEASGPVLVKNGDLSSGTTDSVSMAGTATGSGTYGTVEFPGTLTSMTINGNGGTMTMTGITTSGNLSLQNGTFTIPTMTVGGNLTVSSAATVYSGDATMNPNVVVTGDITLSGSSTLRSQVTTATTEYRLYITAPNITVGTGSSINALNAGYGMELGYNTRTYGNSNFSNSGLVGGTYGGQGGQYSGTAGPGYGSFAYPTDLGSSGVVYTAAGVKYNGGGAVRLAVSGTLTNDGTIHSNASNSGSYGGGSGGSVYIVAGTLTGSGTISANGSTSTYAGGGGGRVAIYYTTASGVFNGSTVYSYVNAFGGNVSTHPGGAGTVFLKSSGSSYGTLIVNNNNVTSSHGLTYLQIPSATTSSTITSTELSSGAFSNTFGASNWYAGMYLNPNTAQNATVTLMDDTFFEITSNTGSSATITSGDLTSIATSGNTFKTALYLDNLEIRGKGKLDFTGQQIVARYGDLSSNNTTSFVLDGTLNVGILDVNGAAYSNGTNAAGTITTKCASNFACP